MRELCDACPPSRTAAVLSELFTVDNQPSLTYYKLHHKSLDTCCAMYPQYPLPRHITALYVVAVTSCLALFSQSVGRVGANVLVYSVAYNREVEMDFRDVPARFGGLLPLDGLKGMVVHAEPDTACEAIQPPPSNYTDNFLGKWVVLIKRYHCSFERKIRNAQKANYSAVIVYNNASDLEPMSANHSEDIYIPSVFVDETAGDIIRRDYQYESGYYVVITDDLPFNFNTHLLLPFAIVVGICFFIMSVFMVVKCIKDRRRQRRHRLPRSSLRKIPTSKFRKGDPYETCAICLEDYREGEKLRILPCSHAYHSKCIDPWLTRNRRVCPVCKRRVFAHDERVSETESETDTDDTTPLVRPGSYGTFAPRENPIQHANHLHASGSQSSLSSAGSQQAPTQPTDPQSKLVLPRPSSDSFLYDSTHNSNLGHSLPSCTPYGQHEASPLTGPLGDEEEALSFNFTSSGEHSINSRPEQNGISQDALPSDQPSEVGEDAAATAVVVPAGVATITDSSGARAKEHDLVV